MSPRLRLLLAGAGGIGRAHAERVRAGDAFELADTLADAWRLVDAAERARVPVLVGHHRRHSAVMAAAHAVIASGRLGRLVAVQGSALFHKPASYFSEAPWRRQKGSGPILNNMVHEVDALCLLAGEIDEVQAVASNARRGHEVEDTVAVTLRFANGALGSGAARQRARRRPHPAGDAGDRAGGGEPAARAM